MVDVYMGQWHWIPYELPRDTKDQNGSKETWCLQCAEEKRRAGKMAQCAKALAAKT